MQITEKAKFELRIALDNFTIQGAGIRIFSSKGCCGPSLKMEIAPKIGIGEIVMSIEGIDFFVANDLMPKLAEVTIEFGSNGFRLT